MSEPDNIDVPPPNVPVRQEGGFGQWRAHHSQLTVGARPGGAYLAVYENGEKLVQFNLTREDADFLARLLIDRARQVPDKP